MNVNFERNSKFTTRIVVILLAFCMSLMCVFFVDTTPANAGTATMQIGCDYGVSKADNTDYMVIITDTTTGEEVFSSLFNSDQYVDYGSTEISITPGHKYLIQSMVPAGYATQIWVTDSESGLDNPLHTNSVILEAQADVTYTIVFYVILQSLGWFDDFTIY